MTRATRRRFKPAPAHPSQQSGLHPYACQFLQWCGSRGYREATVGIREKSLRRFMVWCSERELHDPKEITPPILERYRHYLYTYRKGDGNPLGFTTQQSLLLGVKQFFKWLAKENHILYNPASELELPRTPKRLPRYLLDADEISALMRQTSLHGIRGIRDRAIMETLYSTGIRRMEAANLKLHDIDWEAGIVYIRDGKGGKDRVVPIGNRALEWIERYLQEVRPEYEVNDRETLFLTEYGEPFHNARMGDLVRRYLDDIGCKKPGACHLFRHTMATQMLNNGADVRFIQALLGHASLSTTEIYTHVSIGKLKEIHTATHPASVQEGKGTR